MGLGKVKRSCSDPARISKPGVGVEVIGQRGGVPPTEEVQKNAYFIDSKGISNQAPG
ncbi:MAG: hypothetical protein Q7K57_57750 [Burkholderiaceae bacterium]|nr:hypothetical protein [Burkholderiaceae bacterium]